MGASSCAGSTRRPLTPVARSIIVAFGVLITLLASLLPPLSNPPVIRMALAATARGPGEATTIVINEFLPAPRELYECEWVELYNPGSESLDIGGWVFDDVGAGGSRPFTIPLGTVVAPQGHLLLNSTLTGVHLNNEGDTVCLLDPTGEIVDSFTYTTAEYDISFARVPDGGEWRAGVRPTPGSPNGNPQSAEGAGRLLITQVYYHAYSRRRDEYVAVTNPSPHLSVDVSGWRLADGDSYARFPDGTVIRPGATLFVTGSASDFLHDTALLPDFETLNTTPSVPEATKSGSWPSLSNNGGRIELWDAMGGLIDVFVWGKEYHGAGWTGKPSPLTGAGMVARRALDPAGRWLDTNTSLDWPESRVTVVGRSELSWDIFEAEEVVTFVSPDCSFDVVSREIAGARSRVLLALYQLESLRLTESLIDARARGVGVTVLLEGQPVASLTAQEKALAAMLHGAGATLFFMAGDAPSGSGRRYACMHAKYCVIDNETSIVTSENWVPSGIPEDTSYGNRGWGAVVRSRGLASYLTSLFFLDAQPIMRDIVPYSPSDARFASAPGLLPNSTVPSGGYKATFGPARFSGVRVSPVVSPDTSTLPNASILALLETATDTILIEQLACSPNWSRDGEDRPNEYLEAVVAAARRGVRVRVLLDASFPQSSGVNQDVANELNYLALRENLDLEARVARVPGIQSLHNKGLVVDGRRALVSSLNWVGSAALDNRELGLIIEGEGPASYFEQVFWLDWNLTGGSGGRGGRGETAPIWGLPCPVIMIAGVAVAGLASVTIALRRRRRSR